MDKQLVGRMNCFICGELVTLAIARGWAGQCSRCSMVDDLLEELIRKQLRDARPPAAEAMRAGFAL